MSSPALMQIAPVVLAGRHVRLEQLALSHVDALAEVGLDEELWRWIPVQVRTREGMLAYVRTALQWQADGTALPFVTLEQSSGRAIGSTRFMNNRPREPARRDRRHLDRADVAAQRGKFRGQVSDAAARVRILRLLAR